MTVTAQQLQYFLAAVEHGSLSAAAEANYIAQPSLSEQIRRLEAELGVSLFVRTNRRLIRTDAADLLLPHARRVVAAVEEATQSVRPIRALTGGSVTFGTFSSAHYLLHEDVIADFHTRYPRVTVRMLSLNSSDVADEVRSGRLEAGLVALPVDDRALHVGPVEWRSEAVYLSSDPARTRKPVSIVKLAGTELVLPEVRRGDADPTRRQLLLRAQNAGVRIHPMIEVESPASALALAVRGVSDTVISLPLAHKLGATRKLHWASLDPPLHETFAFITRRDAQLSPAARVLTQLMTRRLHRLRMSAPLPKARP